MPVFVKCPYDGCKNLLVHTGQKGKGQDKVLCLLCTSPREHQNRPGHRAAKDLGQNRNFWMTSTKFGPTRAGKTIPWATSSGGRAELNKEEKDQSPPDKPRCVTRDCRNVPHGSEGVQECFSDGNRCRKCCGRVSTAAEEPCP